MYGIYPKVISRDNISAPNVPIAHAYAFTRFLGKLELIFDDDGNIKEFGGNPILLDMQVREGISKNKIFIQNLI